MMFGNTEEEAILTGVAEVYEREKTRTATIY